MLKFVVLLEIDLRYTFYIIIEIIETCASLTLLFPSCVCRSPAPVLTSVLPLQLLQLWERVPARFALCSPLLLYTSSEHGFSLKTFYQRVGTFEPTVLLLRTTEGEVFGAYCSAHWNTRNELLEDGSRQAYFGTGEVFGEQEPCARDVEG